MTCHCLLLSLDWGGPFGDATLKTIPGDCKCKPIHFQFKKLKFSLQTKSDDKGIKKNKKPNWFIANPQLKSYDTNLWEPKEILIWHHYGKSNSSVVQDMHTINFIKCGTFISI